MNKAITEYYTYVSMYVQYKTVVKYEPKDILVQMYEKNIAHTYKQFIMMSHLMLFT